MKVLVSKVSFFIAIALFLYVLYLDIIASIYLYNQGERFIVIAAWALGGVLSLLLPFLTPFWLESLLAFIFMIIFFIIHSATKSEKY